jgi:ferric-dicitrate binding protein FerR (iron transport regulator)
MKIDINILLDKIHGRPLDEEKRALLENWLNSDESHRAYFEKLEKRELGLSENQYELTEEKQSEYKQQFVDKIKLAGKRKKRQRLQMLSALGAASLILLFFVIKSFVGEKRELIVPAVFTEVLKSNRIEKQDSFAKVPKVSNKKVQLITAKGEKISLLDIKSDESVKSQSFELSEDKMALTYSETIPEKDQGLNTLLVDRGAEFRITLSDGTKIHLNSDSKLEYPTVFNDKERRVFLQGEAYFEVTKDENRPFIVSAGSTEIKVLGTEFNVNSRKPESIKATLVSGSVTVKSSKIEEVQLKPGFTAIVNPLAGSLDIDDKDIQYYIGWNTGNYLFESTSLSDILNELAIWYDLSVEYQTEQANEETFTGSLSRNLSIDKLIQLIERTNYLSLELKGKTLIVKNR